MHLDLLRRSMSTKATLGDLFVDGEFECHTLEDVVRDLGLNGEGKIPGETAIPAGTYQIIVNLSPRFGRILPRLLDVPHFTGILIHKGNKSEDTHGCILVGSDLGDDLVTGSTKAFDALFPKLNAAYQRGEKISITVTNDFQE